MSASYPTSVYRNYPRKERKTFVENSDAAFFLGKLNKHHDREQIYNQLKRLTKQLNFYIVKFDMPNGPNGRGNQGFAFVHTKSKEQARRIIALKHLRLGNQECEVKDYGGRTDAESSTDLSGRNTPDSGFYKVISRPRHLKNPLNSEKSSTETSYPSIYAASADMRPRVNSGILSESSRFSGKFSRNISESESHEDHRFAGMKINSEYNNSNNNSNSDLTRNQQPITMRTEGIEEVAAQQNNYEPSSLVNSLKQQGNSINPVNASQIQPHIADSDLHDQWLDEQTSYVLQNLPTKGLDFSTLNFIANCDFYMEMLSKLNDQQVTEVQNGIGRPIQMV